MKRERELDEGSFTSGKRGTMKDSYSPKAVLFTGGAGFIGSNVLCHLVPKYPECKFVCLDKLTACSNLKNLSEILDFPNFVFVKGDIATSDLVNHLIGSFNIDNVMHFAAETHVDNSFGNSLVFTKTNVLGTHTLLGVQNYFTRKFGGSSMLVPTRCMESQVPTETEIQSSLPWPLPTHTQHPKPRQNTWFCPMANLSVFLSLSPEETTCMGQNNSRRS